MTIREIGDFFVDYIKNDNLGRIANAWLVWADFNGATCSECLQLATLHFVAVDFAKSGVPASLPRELRPKKYPSFMENPFKEQYESTSVLGKIYRAAKYREHVDHRRASLEPDRRLLFPGYQRHLSEAFELLEEYNDRLWGIMSHYGVSDELEAVSGCVSRFSRRAAPGPRGDEDAQSRLNKAVKDLRAEFRDLFWERVQEAAPAVRAACR